MRSASKRVWSPCRDTVRAFVAFAQTWLTASIVGKTSDSLHSHPLSCTAFCLHFNFTHILTTFLILIIDEASPLMHIRLLLNLNVLIALCLSTLFH